MLTRNCVLLFLGVCFSLLLTLNASAQTTIFSIESAGADGPATLYSIDSTTAAATAVGAIGFERCGAMDFNAAGTLYAACERADGSDTPVLITIDLASGAGTEVGPTGITGAVGDISFRGADDVLFAFDVSNDPEHTLFTLDTGTGAATLVGDTGLSGDGGNGITFDGADVLWHSARNGPDLNTLDQTSGAASFSSTLTMPAGLPSAARLSAKDYDAETDTIWAILKETQGAGSISDLVTLDTATGVVTLVAASIPDLDAIAVLPPPPVPVILQDVPSMTHWGLLVLLSLMAGLVLIRRFA